MWRGFPPNIVREYFTIYSGDIPNTPLARKTDPPKPSVVAVMLRNLSRLIG
jgi:hypothetical protein